MAARLKSAKMGLGLANLTTGCARGRALPMASCLRPSGAKEERMFAGGRRVLRLAEQ